jgi:hypothetical protein
MRPIDSAFAALGLKPGAGRAEVDEAYRRLIKLHHPDKSGGDGSRAAEINRAYTALRRSGRAAGPQARPMPAIVRPVERRRRSGRGSWLFGLLLLGGVAGFLILQTNGRIPQPVQFLPLSDDGANAGAAELPLQSFDEPLNMPVIDSAIAQAVRFHSAKDSAAAEIYSRDCQNSLRKAHNLVWFDACAAFDEATLALSSGDSQDDNGDEDSVIAARELSGAQLLSDDSLGADLRLHEIRSQVEMQIVPMLDSAAIENL